MAGFIKILALAFVASVALAQPLIPRAPSMTGLTVVSNLQQLSLVYQDLTFLTNNLQSLKNQSDPGAIVATYANITNTETADETAPQPPVAVDDFDQYGILSAQLNLVMSDRAFLNALSVNKEFFNAAQKTQIRDTVSKQIGIVNNFNSDIAAFAPDVLTATNANSVVLLASLRSLLDSFT